MAEQAKLIGGPLSGRSIELTEGSQVGDIINIPSATQRAGNVSIQSTHGYRLTAHPTEGVIGAWINPADHRRQYGG
jgi:hypothetical protein